jgi:hypothetical protein
LYDVNEFRFEIKEDLFGLGYKRLSVNEIFSASNKLGAVPVDKNSSVADLLFPGLAQKSSKKRGITGQVNNFHLIFFRNFNLKIYRRLVSVNLKMMKMMICIK